MSEPSSFDTISIGTLERDAQVAPLLRRSRGGFGSSIGRFKDHCPCNRHSGRSGIQPGCRRDPMDSGFVRHRKTGNIAQTRNPGGRWKNRALAWPSMNADHIPRLIHRRSRSGAGYREYPGIGADFVFADIGPRRRRGQGWARNSKSTGGLWRNSPIRLEKRSARNERNRAPSPAGCLPA